MKRSIFLLLLLCLPGLLGGCAEASWVESTLGEITFAMAPSWETRLVRTEGGADDSTQSVALDLDLREQTYIALFFYDGKTAEPGYENARSYYRLKYGDPGVYREFRELETKEVDGRQALHVSFWTEPEDCSPYYVEQYLFDSPGGLYIVSLSCYGENSSAIRLLGRVMDSIRFQITLPKNI